LWYCGAKSLALISHPATWYLNFTLRTAFLCSLNRFKSTTRRADGPPRDPPSLALQSQLYKTAARYFKQPEQMSPRNYFKAGAAALFLKFDF